MNIIVIYKSKTGLTKMYAQWIREAINCPMVSLEQLHNKDISSYDIVIYGAGVMAGKMYQLDKMKKIVLPNQKLYLFATGAIALEEDNIISKLKEDSLKILDRQVPFYYYQAGLCYEKMGFFPKKMLKIMYQSLKKKENRNTEEEAMIKAMATSHIDAKKEDIQQLINNIKHGPKI